MPCTIGDPCNNVTASTLDSSDGISAGDSVLFQAGDEWCGSNVAEIVSSSNGTEASPILWGRYGTGDNPKFSTACTQTPSWTSAGGGIYYITGQTQNVLRFVLFEDNGEVLNRIGITSDDVLNNAITAGTFCRSGGLPGTTDCDNVYDNTTGTYLYIRRADGSDPNGVAVRIGSYTHNSNQGSRGLIRTNDTNTKGQYNDFVDLDLRGVNGIGFSSSDYRTRTAGLNLYGIARDGYYNACFTSTGENGSYGRDYRSTIQYAAANGRGSGQALTIGCNNFAALGTHIYNNFMAGPDGLDFATNMNVTEMTMNYVKAHNNGLDEDSGSQDPNGYYDGASESAIYNSEFYIGGVESSGGGANPRSGFGIGSEHASTDPAESIDMVDTLIYGTDFVGLNYDNTGSTANIKDARVWNSTIVALSTGFSRAIGFTDMDTTASNLKIFGNIIVSNSGNTAWNPTTTIATSIMDEDWNLFWRPGGSTSILSINSVAKTIADWRTDTGEGANSIVGDPLFVTSSDTAMDANLQDGSPAIDACGTNAAFVPQSWLATNALDIFPTTASRMPGRGTTRASGVIDDPTTAMDCGRHKAYAYVYPANIEPESLTAATVGNINVSFTLSDTAILYTDKIKITLPSDFVWDSGGTTAISSVVGMNGTFTLGVSGQVLTITRVGDGYSSLPTDFSFTLSNVKNPTAAGAAGTYLIELYESDGTTKVATSAAEYGMAIESDTFVSPGPVAHITFNGTTLTCTSTCVFS